MQGLTIISGPRDSGKTRMAAEVVSRLRAAGRSAGGLISQAEIRGKQKVAYAFRDVMTDAVMSYARRRPGRERGFEFSDAGLAFGCAAIRQAVAAGVEVLVVDEVGPLEMAGSGLWVPVREAAATFPGLFILTVRPSLVNELCARLGVAEEGARIVSPSAGPDTLV